MCLIELGGYTDYTKLLNLPDLSKYALISSVPTKVSDLTNDSGFVTHDTTYSADEITIRKANDIFERKRFISRSTGSAYEWVEILEFSITSRYGYGGFNITLRGEGRTDAQAPYIQLLGRVKQQNDMSDDTSYRLLALTWSNYTPNNCYLIQTSNTTSLKKFELWVLNNAGYQSLLCTVNDYYGGINWTMTAGELPDINTLPYIIATHEGHVGYSENADNATNTTNDSDGNPINTTYVKKSGDTMTGQLITSFKNSVANGSYASEQRTIPDFINEVRYSSGASGSLDLMTAYTKDDVTIPVGWYNFIYLPHRTGGVNGQSTGDNCNYGTLILAGMTLYDKLFKIMIKSTSDYVAELIDLLPHGSIASGDTKAVTGGAVYDYLSTNFDVASLSVRVKPTYNADKFISKTWNGKTDIRGNDIWTDGENIYYSYKAWGNTSTKQYVLNKSTSTWVEKTWNGITIFEGRGIWTDGENIYYNYYDSRFEYTASCVLNKATSTWSTKTWNGLANFDSSRIWTDGENIYHGHAYVLNVSTSTWSTKTWNGLADFDSVYIWTDGENIYYSKEEANYVLNRSTSTWVAKTWNGLDEEYGELYGNHIFTYKGNIYYSYYNSYMLDKATSTWVAKTWNGLSSFNGDCVWSDGTNLYYSDGTGEQYVLSDSTYGKVKC